MIECVSLRREGKLLQSRVIRDRLYKELDRNVALKVYETDNSDTYEVSYFQRQEANIYIYIWKSSCPYAYVCRCVAEDSST